jgi:hypothetical protein
MNDSKTPGPLGSASAASPGPVGSGVLGPSAPPGPTGSAPSPPLPTVLPALAAPAPFAFPSVKTPVAAAAAPGLPDACPTDKFFNDPPTRNQQTAGTTLSPAEVAKRRKLVEAGISFAKTDRPISAEFLQNWLDGKSVTKVMPTSIFRKVDSEVPTFLAQSTRDEFEKGITQRLKNPNDPRGTLLPTTLTPGAVGPIRFIQFENGVTPSMTATSLSTDLATSLGAYNVHSAAWVQATLKEHKSGIPIFGTPSNVFEVKFLRWCVQAYDVYDWNHESKKNPFSGKTPFPLTQQQAATVDSFGALSGGAFWMPISLTLGGRTLVIPDSWFRDLEVSGVGRAFLVRSETFEAPKSVMGVFTIEV